MNQNYPNPFNPITIITYTLPEDVHVILKIYNILGQEVKTLINQEMSAGIHRNTLNMQNMPSGLYFYRMKAGQFSKKNKMML